LSIDGSQHSKQVDIERTLFLKQRGYKVLRFWNNNMFNNPDGVMENICQTIEQQER
jgi:very-short-patch-repair endonuclease